MDLSNYLLVRTREHMLLQNRVQSQDLVERKLRFSFYQVAQPTLKQALPAAAADLRAQLIQLVRVLTILGESSTDSLPVAFATNALYVLERNRDTVLAICEEIGET
jgi:hypothetical protein